MFQHFRILEPLKCEGGKVVISQSGNESHHTGYCGLPVTELTKDRYNMLYRRLLSEMSLGRSIPLHISAV